MLVERCFIERFNPGAVRVRKKGNGDRKKGKQIQCGTSRSWPHPPKEIEPIAQSWSQGALYGVILPHDSLVEKGQGCIYWFPPVFCLPLVKFLATELYFPLHFWIVRAAHFGQLLGDPNPTPSCKMLQPNLKQEGKAGAWRLGLGTGTPGVPRLTGTVEAVTKPSCHPEGAVRAAVIGVVSRATGPEVSF